MVSIGVFSNRDSSWEPLLLLALLFINTIPLNKEGLLWRQSAGRIPVLRTQGTTLLKLQYSGSNWEGAPHNSFFFKKKHAFRLWHAPHLAVDSCSLTELLKVLS